MRLERRLRGVLLLSPRLIGLHLVALAAISSAGWLGLWQYDGWVAGRAAQASDLANAAPQELESVMGPDDPFPGGAVGRTVEFAGQWVTGSTFLVAGRELAERTGYWVVTPVAVCQKGCAASPAMLVVRGWTPQRDFRDAPKGRVRVAGWLQPPEDAGRPDADPADDVLAEVRVADAIQRVDQDLYGAYVIAEAPRSAALRAVTPASLPEPEALTSLRNLLYALEWWVFGAFALFVWWRWCVDAAHGPTARVASGP